METAKQKFERERLTRRQALKRFGLTSAMTAFALFSVDDLARMVGAAMERQAKNSKIAEQVAQEFQSAGIAIGAVRPASGSSITPNDVYGKSCTCQPYCNGNCTCLCQYDFCITERQLCDQYPSCCDSACQPIGSTACAYYSTQIAAAKNRQTNCESNPSAYGHGGCT